MASEEAEPVRVGVSEDVRSWLERTARDRGVDVDDYVAELVRAHRMVERDGSVEGDAPGGELPPTLDERVSEVRSEFTELIEDVRERVIQVKRETDRKAPAEHEHPDLASELSDLAADVERIEWAVDTRAEDVNDFEASVESLEESVEALESDLSSGFENYETVLEHLVDAADRLDERADRLARATVDARERLADVEASVNARERVDRIKRDAALEGVDAASCEECDTDVRLALLTEPACPACGVDVATVEPKRGLFGSPTLVTGDQPALHGTQGDDVNDEIEAALEADRPDPADVDWDTASEDDR